MQGSQDMYRTVCVVHECACGAAVVREREGSNGVGGNLRKMRDGRDVRVGDVRFLLTKTSHDLNASSALAQRGMDS